MTLPEIPQQLSGVKISENAKGDPSVTVHVYVGASDDDLRIAHLQAVKLYEDTRRAVR